MSVESPSNSAATSSGDDVNALRAERDQLAQKQQRLAELLACPPAKIEHEVRNVLNELRLLRTLFEQQEKE